MAGLGFPEGELDGVEIDRSTDHARVPDEFQRLWAPHRMTYIVEGQDPDPTACPFCRGPELPDEHSLIVARGTYAFVVMNLYPYNSGHLLVCPYRHIATYDEADDEEILEIGHLTQTAMRVLGAQAHVEGFNIGMNQGRVAGAGIAGHLHQHIVPRWALDSNFFPIIAKTKAIPVLMGDLREWIADHWPDAD
ncbi:HIT domain-containing protein [Pseudoclavibacter chungangensis]|uniref:HIT domain-containing protein n=1 Tax=Pseudoclavibacter chungangensis TaxID=587635 RepID=A0A7J5BWL9_9MICO|nr:HIT domain-containing protein [Pseudoclavibacter chungangensis]KAB1657879.1 HIT domain-containing protein [Pseudoclavibacter chungangensis]NYJ66518.1 ATP adenylyltransferase [Pseudoclavibacter chungangensis]